jgi:hypothetical protein
MDSHQFLLFVTSYLHWQGMAGRIRPRAPALVEQEDAEVVATIDWGAPLLLLSHAAWLSIALGCAAMASSQMRLYQDTPQTALLITGIGWTSIGLAALLLTAYLVGITWAYNNSLRKRVFGSLAFALLYVLMAGIALFLIWTLIAFATL